METRSFTSENEQHFEHRDISDNNNTTKCEEKSLQKKRENMDNQSNQAK